jgi:hypothetical protein
MSSLWDHNEWHFAVPMQTCSKLAADKHGVNPTPLATAPYAPVTASLLTSFRRVGVQLGKQEPTWHPNNKLKKGLKNRPKS